MTTLLTGLLGVILVGVGLKAVLGRGLALTLYRSSHGPNAKSWGAVFLIVGIAVLTSVAAGMLRPSA